MSMTYEALRSAVLRRSAAIGVTPGTAAMQTMTLGVMAMAEDLPANLKEQLVAAERRWLAPVDPLPVLTAGRVAAWQFLGAKNADSTTIEDRVDIAVRALICVLWDEADEGSEMEDGLEFFAQLAERYGGLEQVLGLGMP